MKILAVYYSRTGNTGKLAKFIAQKTGAQAEEIKETKSRKGIWGWLGAGRDAMKKKPAELVARVLNPADFDLVLVGSPIWAGDISSPIRTYLLENKNNFKKLAFFCTMGGSAAPSIESKIEAVVGRKPIALLAVSQKDAAANDFSRAAAFIESVMRD